MRDLVAGVFAQQPDLEVVGELYDEKDLLAAVEALVPDVLVVELDQHNQLPRVCLTILTKRPALKVIGLAADRDVSIFCWADVEVRTQQIENSERGLLEAIRGKSFESSPLMRITPSGKPN
jgi:hypothetical protein